MCARLRPRPARAAVSPTAVSGWPIGLLGVLRLGICPLQQWRSLTKDGDLEAFDDMLSKMKSTASSLLRRSRRTVS
uniref:Uncharacterized protein n=1 Tax=Triticum urartu TaxID=4572 RepID=A0A8R7QSA8_TRIUA